MHHVELRPSIKFGFFPFFFLVFWDCEEKKMVMKVKLEKEKLETCLTCPICNDLFDRATTISECLHTFCRKCIHDKIKEEDLDACPVCNADLGCAPLEKLRPDHSLQDLRLKLFPVNGENFKAETVTPAAPLPSSRKKEKSLSSLVASSPRVSSLKPNADATKQSKQPHEKDYVHLVPDLLVVEKTGEKVDDVPQIKSSSRGLPKSRAGRRKSKPSPEKNDVQLASNMLIEEEPHYNVENAPQFQSASKMLPDIAQDNRLYYEAVPSEGDMQKENIVKQNDRFPRRFELWKPLSCLAEAAEQTKFGKSNEQKNTAVSEPHHAHQDDAHITNSKGLDGNSMRDDAPDQMIVEPVVPSNCHEDGKSVPSSDCDKAKTSVDKPKDSSNGNDFSLPSLRPRKRRKLLGDGQKNDTVPEVLSTSRDATTVEVNNIAVGRNIPVWFSLIASENQGTNAPLPQISSCYLRVKDINLPVSCIKKYLVKKLSLASEAEVEISLRGEPLLSSQRLHSLVEWWVQTAPASERISASIGSSGKDFIMVLSYSRKSLL